MSFLPDRGRKRGYFKNIFLGIDQGWGTWLGIDADEAISSYLGREMPDSWQRRAVDWMALHWFGEHDHCKNSIERHLDCK